MDTAPTVKPLIGIPAGMMQARPGMLAYSTGERNVDAITEVARGLALIIPALGSRLDIPGLLDSLDGLLLTGGASNIEPHHYSGPPARHGDLHDPHRDATTIPLIRAAVDMGVPVFAICRGIQEFNVAFGGTLHQFLHEVPGRMDHRRDRTKPIQEQMKPAHTITIRKGGPLHAILGSDTAGVNSLHGQGIDRPGKGLVVEATAEDSTIEAMSVAGARAFALGVQWHPEFDAGGDPVSRALFTAFGDAARARARQRR